MWESQYITFMFVSFINLKNAAVFSYLYTDLMSPCATIYSLFRGEEASVDWSRSHHFMYIMIYSESVTLCRILLRFFSNFSNSVKHKCFFFQSDISLSFRFCIFTEVEMHFVIGQIGLLVFSPPVF